MGKSNPSPPAAPDYTGAAQAQGAANVDAAVASAALGRVNQYGPMGSSVWVPPAAARTAPQMGFGSLQPFDKAGAPPLSPPQLYSPQSASQPAQQPAPRPTMQPQDGRIDPRSMSPFGVPWSIGPTELGESSTEDQGPSFEPYQGGREYDGGNITGFDFSKAGNLSPTLGGINALRGQWQSPFEMDSSRTMYSQGPDGTGGQIWSDNPSRVGVEVAGYNGRTNPREGAPQGGQGGSGYGSGTGYGQAGGQQAMGYGGQAYGMYGGGQGGQAGYGGGYGMYGGSSGYNIMDPWSVVTSLTPEAQKALDAQKRVQSGLSGLAEQGIGTAQRVLGTPFNPSLPNLRTDLGNMESAQGLDINGLPAAPINAGMTAQQAIMSRLQEQMDTEAAAERNRLINQGLVPGGEAYDREMRLLNQRQNDQRTQATLQGIGLDTQARQNAFQERLSGQSANNAAAAQNFNRNLQGAQFGNQAQQQSLAQQLALRNQPLNEIAALMSGSQVQLPQFQQFSGQNVSPSPVFGATQAGADASMQNYGINQAGVNAQNAGMYGLGSSGLMALGMFSDRRLKSNIVRVGTHPRGFGIYDYDIFGERKTGVMADEIEAIVPEAVMVHSSGFKMVNYGAL